MRVASVLIASCLLFGPASAWAQLEDAGLRGPYGSIQLAVYFDSAAQEDPVGTAVARLESAGFFVTADPNASMPEVFPAVMVMTPPIAEFAPPDLETLGYFGVGFDDGSRQRVPLLDGVVVFMGIHDDPAEYNWISTLSIAAADIAASIDGVVWDEDTRQAFTISAWREERVNSTQEGIPDVISQTVTHYYEEVDGYRLISLGMSRFGLPDIAISDVSPGAAESLQHVMMLVMQAMLEGHANYSGDELVANLDRISHPALAAIVEAAIGIGGDPTAQLRVATAEPRAGDPLNSLLELQFSPDPASRYEEQSALVNRVLGANTDVAGVSEYDPAMVAAMASARAELVQLLADFEGQIPDLTTLYVKAPFSNLDGSVEHMWFVVTGWDEVHLNGILDNTPMGPSDLVQGSIVQVPLAEVSDFIVQWPDGTQGGDFTGALLGTP